MQGKQTGFSRRRVKNMATSSSSSAAMANSSNWLSTSGFNKKRAVWLMALTRSGKDQGAARSLDSVQVIVSPSSSISDTSPPPAGPYRMTTHHRIIAPPSSR